jgi:hypothetical protein
MFCKNGDIYIKEFKLDQVDNKLAQYEKMMNSDKNEDFRRNYSRSS